MYEVGGRALGGRPITLDTLPLLQNTAEHDTNGEEQESSSYASWRVVVLYPATTVGAVVPGIIINAQFSNILVGGSVPLL